MARILITGGAGFIGYHLGKALAEQGTEIELVDNLSRGHLDGELTELVTRPNVRFSELDLLATETESLPTDYEQIFHLSAIVGVQNVLRMPLRVLRENVLMLLRVLDVAARQKRLDRIVFASTSEVYAGTLASFELPIPTPETVPLAVTDMAAPRTSYMLSKLYGEALCRQSGLPFSIVRPHNVSGPRMGMAHVVPELLFKAHAAGDGSAIDVSSVDHRRTFCYISDAVEMIHRIGREPRCAGEVLNVGTQQPEVTIGELAEIVIATVGKGLSVHPTAVTPGSPERRCPDMSKLAALTGYRSQVPLRTGIEKTYAWYREHEFLSA
jgi:UDP-glucose 4-epimerase